MALTLDSNRTTPTAARPGPKLHQATQRLLVGILGFGCTLSVGLLAASDRLTAAVQLDDVQAVELASVRDCLEQIRENPNADRFSRQMARIALVRLDRAEEADRTRDGHVARVGRLVDACRRSVRRIAAAVEHALIAQGAPGTGAPS